MDTNKDKSTKTDLEQALQRVVFLECLCSQYKAQNEAAQEREQRLQKTLDSNQQREQDLHSKLAEYEKLLEQNAIQIKELSSRLHAHQSLDKETELDLRFSNDQLHSQLSELSRQHKKGEGDQALLMQRFLDARERANTLERTNEQLFSKLLALYESLHIKDGADVDMAGFISSLRAEVLSLQDLLKRAQQRETQITQSVQDDETTVDANQDTSNEDAAADSVESAQPDAQTTESTQQSKDDIFEMLIGDIAPEDRPLAEHYFTDLRDEKKCVGAAKRLVELLGKSSAAWILWAVQGYQTPDIRAQLILCLGQTKDKNIFNNVAGFFDREPATVKLSTLDCCAVLAPQGSPELLDLLQKACQDTDALVRRRALIHLSSIKHTNLGNQFCSCLNDADPQVRRLACIGLAATTDLETAQCLIGCLTDQDQQVVQSAANAIERIFGLSANRLIQQDQTSRKSIITRLRAYLGESADRLAPEGRLLDATKLAKLIPQSFIWRETITQKEKTIDPDIAQNIRAIVQSSLSGCSESQLAKELSIKNSHLREVIDQMIQQDLLVRRGSKVFSA